MATGNLDLRTLRSASIHTRPNEPGSDTSTSFRELAASAEQLPDSEELKQLNSWKSTPTLKESCERISPMSLFGQTSETTIPPQENLTSSVVGFPAREPAARASGKDCHTPIQPCGEKESAASLSAVPDSVLLNNLKEWSDADFEQCLGDCEWQDTLTKLKLSRRSSLARVTLEPDCLSFPTLTSGDRSLHSRPAGQTKCERWFKENGLIPPGYQLSAQAMALMMGFPENWFDCLSPPIIEDGSEADTSPEGLSPQHRQRSPSNGFSTSTQLLGDRKNLTPSTNNPRKTRRKKGQGNGSIYYRLVTKNNGQQYQEAYYHYLENGRKKTQYIPKKLLDQVKEAELLKLPVREILVLLGGAAY